MPPMPRKKIIQNKENIRLSIVHQVYKEKIIYTKMPDGELIPEKKEKLKKEMTVHKWFKRDAITSVQEYVTASDRIAKSRCVVFDKYSGRSFVTYHSSDELMSYIAPDAISISGFHKKLKP